MIPREQEKKEEVIRWMGGESVSEAVKESVQVCKFNHSTKVDVDACGCEDRTDGWWRWPDADVGVQVMLVMVVMVW